MKYILTVLLFLLTFSVFSQELPLLCQEFAPYNYIDEEGNVTGASYEIVVEIMKRMGIKPTVAILPWNRAYKEVADGKSAMLFTFSKSPEREKDMYFTNGLIFIEVVFFKRKTDNITWNTLYDVKDYRIGYVSGYNYGETLMKAIDNKLFTKADVIGASATVDYQQFIKLTKNRIDLAVCPSTQGTRIIQLNAPEFDGLDYIKKSIGPKRDFYGGFSKKWPNALQLRNRFNAQHQKLIDEGFVAGIFKKYGITD